jgi:hypothetical protein
MRLDVSTRTIDRLRATGELDWIRVGRVVRIDLGSLEAYERRRRLIMAQTRPNQGEALARLPIPALDKVRRQP